MWKNIVERGRPQMTIWRVRIACWILKATDTHSQYVILIYFPLQQWLRERAPMLTLYVRLPLFAVQLSCLSESFRSCHLLSCMSFQRFPVLFLLSLISFKEIPGFRLPQVGHGHFHHISLLLRALSLSATVVSAEDHPSVNNTH
jgi:hypothetical protein